ncbi:MAG: hypothetical protein AAFQ82_11280, partial [Myxococcota bacterium]
SPEIEGSPSCPQDLQRVSVQLFQVVDGTPNAELTTQRLIDEPCDENELAEIFIEQILADLAALSDGVTPVEYRLDFQAESDTESFGCLTLLARVPPGAPSSSSAIPINLTVDRCE